MRIERRGEEELHNLLAKLESEEVVVEKFLNRQRELVKRLK